MIVLTNLKSELKKRLKSLNVGNVLEITTYKRNRGLVISCLTDESYQLREFGYQENTEGPLTKEEVIKLSLKLAKIEFPRSQQVRLYQHEKETENLISAHIDIRI